jgi:flagellar motor protein MotB
MKKLLCAFIAMLMLNTFSFAQDAKAPAAGAKQEKKAEAKKGEEKKGGAKLKKDGTPDMRYKENKEKKAGEAKENKGKKMKGDKKDAPKAK